MSALIEKIRQINYDMKFIQLLKNVFIMDALKTQKLLHSLLITFYWQKYYIIIIQQISCQVKFKKKKTLLLESCM